MSDNLKSGDVGAFKPVSVPVQHNTTKQVEEKAPAVPAFVPRKAASNATPEQAHDTARVVSGAKKKAEKAEVQDKVASQDW